MVPRSRLYPLIVLHGAACLILLAVVWGAILAGLYIHRAYHLRTSQALAVTLADATAQHMTAALTDIDKTSQALRRAYLRDPANFDRFLRDTDAPQVIFPTFQVSVINAAGFLAYSSGQPVTAPVDLRDRLHYRYHLTSATDDLYVSRVVIGRVSNTQSLQFTRKIIDDAGTFKGVIVLSVAHDYFVQFLRSVAIPPDGLVALIGSDGWLRARVNSLDTGVNSVPPSLFETPLQDAPFLDAKRPSAGLYDMPASLEGVQRIGAYQRLAVYPLTVLVMLSREEVNAVSRDILGPFLGGGLLLSGILILGTLLGLRLILKREAAITAMAQREAQLRDLANNDVLTGIANRRYFIDRASVEIARSLRHRRPLALAMLDLDHFKRINDHYGHAGGDAVLQEVVRRIRARLRREDLIGRLGGEEFAILLPETEIEGALTALDLIRLLIAESPFLLPDGQQVQVTVSIGVADLKTEAGYAPEDLDQLMKRADEALYAAKRGGRNRVILDVGPSPFTPHPTKPNPLG
ncbi:hypothetical protein GCM10011497_16470 [Elstera cyanobacteriorum]|uniref:diguanylate cyclase n=1 Tax=Elstera cyanobacteriorum TaxID=2022747 RepID=A0A255XK13_9PROT|nr:sensor domain-containing diguanylate cyclase [Elstera cyanobacteriorum]OYQ16724.1 hypothetical protein CHR90_17205 [Elstera cyanobacteriorum]GFZ88107.1 hypothetical protein GCM10011497_16470 [Elstera cyanobacteriorum]